MLSPKVSLKVAFRLFANKRFRGIPEVGVGGVRVEGVKMRAAMIAKPVFTPPDVYLPQEKRGNMKESSLATESEPSGKIGAMMKLTGTSAVPVI